ncbi:glycosyltransferase family 2 protein [Microbacterium sp. CnD16-F]|uniref:glycosyltransferase family 2 protein n=1 Tax=Microbacterium sp. CnD16-F TaxID=2954493 RepID=UPI0020969144|nr:glycosyltransferase family 2 protein [Microbacterium sp. CnD16-F]MCO7203230.1 glycosyltransferase family 2 protein [Microbacterium sp. CnD16-F]
MTPRAAVVIVNYGASAILEPNAATVQPPGDGFVVVVDCFSSTDERARIDVACRRHGWVPVLLERNAGFGGGTNAGAALALERGAEVVVALNPDATIDRESLAQLVQAAADDRLALVSPTILDGGGGVWFGGSDLYLDDGSIAGARRRAERAGRPRHEWATGACFAMSAELWSRVGGFDEEYFLYWEDVDLSRRVLDLGGSLRTLPVTAVHDEGQTHLDAVRGRAKSETYYYFNIRNRLLYAAKHGDAETVRRWSRATLRVSWLILMQGGRAQLRSIRPWRALARGIRDGRRALAGAPAKGRG